MDSKRFEVSNVRFGGKDPKPEIYDPIQNHSSFRNPSLAKHKAEGKSPNKT